MKPFHCPKCRLVHTEFEEYQGYKLAVCGQLFTLVTGQPVPDGPCDPEKEIELGPHSKAIFTLAHTKGGRPRQVRVYIDLEANPDTPGRVGIVINGDAPLFIEPSSHNTVRVYLRT